MRHIQLFLLLILLAFVLALPFLFNASVVNIAVFAIIFATAATSWNIFSGYTGYISLGHATYYGIGAYSLALICQHWNIPGGYLPFVLLPASGLIAAAFALPLGWVALGSRRYTFVVITIAILFIFQLLAYNMSMTNGAQGMYFPIPPWERDQYNLPFFYVALALLLSASCVSWWVRRSKFGLNLLAIRDDEERARSLGVQTEQLKLMAYIISAFFIGMVGGIDGYFGGFISPSFAFAPIFDVTVALMVLFGGVATLSGPILGSLLLEPLQQYLTIQLGIAGLDLIVFGSLLLVVILALPEGIIPAVRKRRKAGKAP